MRPSAYNQRERADGGPFLVLEPDPEDNGTGVTVWFTDTAPEVGDEKALYARLLHVTSDLLRIWPLNVRPGRADYLKPKYGTLECIAIARRVEAPWSCPVTAEDVALLLEALPDGFAKDYRFGLGLLWEYRAICETIAENGQASMLIVHAGEEATLDPPTYVLGVKRFHRLRKAINRISSRHQREQRLEKAHLAYQEMMHAADPELFPTIRRSLPPDTLAEATQGGSDGIVLSPRDRTAVVRLVRTHVETLAKSDAAQLQLLKSDIEQVALKALIVRIEDMFGKALPESRWQAFLEQNPFVLSLAFAVPTVVVESSAYVGGKQFNNTGGRITDFLCASAASGNLAIVEIKTPTTDLVTRTAYRGRDVFSPTAALNGAVAQVLDQRLKLQTSWVNIKEMSDQADLNGYAIRCIVVSGRIPADKAALRAFELYRSALTEVTIVTFDELLDRLKAIDDVLSTPKNEHDVPF